MAAPRRIRIALVVLATLSIGTAGLWHLGQESGGLRNVFSLAYWEARSEGRDEYEPEYAWFRRGPRDRQEVCLTIDDGPHGASTQAILDILAKERVPATFFAVGERMRQHPDLIKEMLAAGHEVGNHTQTHARLDKLSDNLVREEIDGCDRSFHAITGRRMTLFRPPGMRDSPEILSIAKRMGYHTVDWNAAAKDYLGANQSKEGSSQLIAERIISNARNGSIILLHDQQLTADALPQIISRLRQEGFRFVTCSQALVQIDHPVYLVANPSPPQNPVAGVTAPHRATQDRMRF